MAKVRIVVEVEVSGPPHAKPSEFEFVSITVGDDTEACTLPPDKPAPRRLAEDLALAAAMAIQNTPR